jgi:hypothetical protein
MPVFTRWLAGDPSPLLDPGRLDDFVEPVHGTSSRDAFVAAAFRSVMLACWWEASPLNSSNAPDLDTATFDNPATPPS